MLINKHIVVTFKRDLVFCLSVLFDHDKHKKMFSKSA